MAAEARLMSVLVVEDEPELADLYGDLLEVEHEVSVVYDGDTALELLADTPVDVVILDRRMPGQSGDDVLQTMRGRGIDSGVAMVTAVKPDLDIIAMEFDDYLTKPVTGAALREAVERTERAALLPPDQRRLERLRRKHELLRDAQTRAALADSEAFAELEDELRTLANHLNQPLPDDLA